MRGRQDMTWLPTAVLGIAGSLVLGFVSWLICGGQQRTIKAADRIMSILAAIAVALAYGKWKGPHRVVSATAS